MAEIDGGRLFAKALRREGVEYIFTLNGGHIYNLYEGCVAEGMKIIRLQARAGGSSRRRRLGQGHRQAGCRDRHRGTRRYRRRDRNRKRLPGSESNDYDRRQRGDHRSPERRTPGLRFSDVPQAGHQVLRAGQARRANSRVRGHRVPSRDNRGPRTRIPRDPDRRRQRSYRGRRGEVPTGVPDRLQGLRRPGVHQPGGRYPDGDREADDPGRLGHLVE